MSKMKKYVSTSLFLFLCCLDPVFSLSVSSENANIIGAKVWKNECAGTIDGLTNWKQGEDFPSLGIGHFIWYPADKEERFKETFPSLLTFLQKQNGVTLPAWLKTASGSPWKSREEFYQNFQSPEMKSLRQFLYETRDLQAIFIANRLEKALPDMMQNLSKEEKEKIKATFEKLVKDPNGLYALIDYLNFKGEGTSPTETYNGQGWGLLQVLQRIPPTSKRPLVDFIVAAKAVLTQRIQNAPPERREERWIKGWFNRIDTYADTR